MEQFNSIVEILDYAIDQEQQAQTFYQSMADKMTNQAQKKMFEELVAQEKSHESRLKAVKADRVLLPEPTKVTDLKIVDYSVDVTEEEIAQSEKPEVQKAYLLAMKKEKAACKMYTDLAETSDIPPFTELFQSLATEEAKHKLKLETEYDDHYLKEN